MAEGDYTSAYWAAYLTFLYSQGKIDVPSDFRTRISAIRYVLDSDVTGLINTVLDYSINVASQTDFTIECADDTLKALLNEWLRYINLEVDGVPTGIGALAREYYKERWRESSLILVRAKKWRDITVNGTTISVPTILYLVNSASIYVKRDKDNYQLGTDKYYLDRTLRKELPTTGEQIVIQRPFDRLWTEYATPYLVRKGIYRNYKALEMLQEKTEEVLTKFLPYLFAITKGTERLFLDGKVEYTDEDLKTMQEQYKESFEKYKRQKGKTPVATVPFDTKFEHIMPDLKNVLSMELFNQGYRAILAGLGFVDVIQGLTSTRKEAVLNPAPFIEEVNDGVEGFKSLLIEIIYKIMEQNKLEHSRLCNRNKKFYIANSPLKINVDPVLDHLRQSFIYGACSVKTYQEFLHIDPETERERMKDEWENGDRELYYPHIIQNQEDKGIDTNLQVPLPKKPPITKKQVEKDAEKTGNPELTYKTKAELLETDNYFRNRIENPAYFQKDSFRTIFFSKEKGIKAIVGKKKGETSLQVQSLLFDKEKFTKQQAEKWVRENYTDKGTLTDNIEDAPYHKVDELPDAVKKLSIPLQKQWMAVWNNTYEKYKDESRAYRTAWSIVNKNREKGEVEIAETEEKDIVIIDSNEELQNENESLKIQNKKLQTAVEELKTSVEKVMKSKTSKLLDSKIKLIDKLLQENQKGKE